MLSTCDGQAATSALDAYANVIREMEHWTSVNSLPATVLPFDRMWYVINISGIYNLTNRSSFRWLQAQCHVLCNSFEDAQASLQQVTHKTHSATLSVNVAITMHLYVM